MGEIADLPERAEGMLHEEALLYQSMGLIDDAERRLRLLVRRQPLKGRYQTDLGILCFTAGRAKESISHLQEALRLDPEDISAALSLSSVYLSQGEPQRAQILERRIRDLCGDREKAGCRSFKP